MNDFPGISVLNNMQCPHTWYKKNNLHAEPDMVTIYALARLRHKDKHTFKRIGPVNDKTFACDCGKVCGLNAMYEHLNGDDVLDNYIEKRNQEIKNLREYRYIGDNS